MKNNKLLFLSALAVFSLTSCGGEVTPSVNVSSSNEKCPICGNDLNGGF